MREKESKNSFSFKLKKKEERGKKNESRLIRSQNLISATFDSECQNMMGIMSCWLVIAAHIISNIVSEKVQMSHHSKYLKFEMKKKTFHSAINHSDSSNHSNNNKQKKKILK